MEKHILLLLSKFKFLNVPQMNKIHQKLQIVATEFIYHLFKLMDLIPPLKYSLFIYFLRVCIMYSAYRSLHEKSVMIIAKEYQQLQQVLELA